MTIQTLEMYVPLDIRELVQDAIGDNMLFVDPSHELFDESANGDLNKKAGEEVYNWNYGQ
ncbi:MAG TPA: hypothetical protein VN456_10495 [Desulfosporosinus sp.]|nr:hypothetical protein [Desulfosporosinus sp.]